MMEMEKAVSKQLELDFSSEPDASEQHTSVKHQAQIIDFQQSKMTIALRSKEVARPLSEEVIRSKIDSLLSRYK